MSLLTIKIISNILDRHGKKKLQEIDRNCMSTIDSRGINFKVYSADKKAAAAAPTDKQATGDKK